MGMLVIKIDPPTSHEQSRKGKSNLMLNAVQVFKGSINEIQNTINGWAEQYQVTILSTSICYDEGAGLGQVFVIVVYAPSTR